MFFILIPPPPIQAGSHTVFVIIVECHWIWAASSAVRSLCLSTSWPLICSYIQGRISEIWKKEKEKFCLMFAWVYLCHRNEDGNIFNEFWKSDYEQENAKSHTVSDVLQSILHE